MIEPKILKGTRDFGPLEMSKRNRIMDLIRQIFERFGYDPIETPIINPAEIILGKYGEEGDRLTYSFKDNGDRLLALPYDLTVPFARFVAANWQDLPMPFKRYQIQRVWRAEKPQKGRLREFYQCDIDIIGTKNLIAEAEVARIIMEIMTQLEITFLIKVNSRRLMNTVLADFGIEDEKFIEAIRVIDKIAKIGEDAVIEELEKLEIKNAKKIIELLKPEKDLKSTLKKLNKYDLSEIEEFIDNCTHLGLEEKNLQFDPSLARGLDYYTGIIYEVMHKDGKIGALCAGGRYDNLCGIFCKQAFSGVGVSFGFERIMILLEELGVFKEQKINSKALITIFDEESKADALDLYADLMSAGVNCEIYFEPVKLAKQLKYADRKGIPFVIIRGEEERSNGQVTIKFMKSGKQKQIPINQVSSYFLNYYESHE